MKSIKIPAPHFILALALFAARPASIAAAPVATNFSATASKTLLQTPEHPVIILPSPGANAAADSASDKTLRLNFRGAPLERVLDYLADAAGFTVILEAEIKGNVDVWSDQPLTRDEAVNLLNAMLSRNGYAAIRNDRTLTIVNRADARRHDLPVRKGNIPADIPRNAEFVTQVIPVRSLNVVQLPKDLAPLLAPESTLTANESGNSLIMTDTQANIRRMTEIIKALDSATIGINSIRIFPLKYSDAKALAGVIKELFPSPDSSRLNNNNNGGNNFGRFRGGGGNFNAMAAMMTGAIPGDGGGEPSAGAESGGGHTPAARVSAVADDHSNSLIVSAPEELVLTIGQLVKSVDNNMQDITELRAFRLQNADPAEMADLLAGLFPDETNPADPGRTVAPFAFSGLRGALGGGPLRPASAANPADAGSDRLKRLGRVLAVADRRTASVIVSSARDLMPQIAAIIEELDANPARKQKVFIYPLRNADVVNVQQILQELFPPSNNARSPAAQNNNDPLALRSQTLPAQTQPGPGSANAFGASFGGGNNAGNGRGF